MVIMNLHLDNFLVFNDFELCMSYPKKIVRSTIEDECLSGRERFRYKKVVILMGANATGKTALGRILMSIFNFIDGKEYGGIAKLIDDKKKTAEFTIDLACVTFLAENREAFIVMIILITGASHTGKTVLAQIILEKYRYPYLSIDHLKMGLIRSGNTDLTPEDDDALTEYLWPIVREMVKTAVENRQNLIVEGCYIPFDWRQDFDEQYLAHIRFICLVMTEEYIENHFDEIISHESEVETRLVEADCTIAGLTADNKKYVDGFQKAGEHVVIIDGDYEEAIEALLI